MRFVVAPSPASEDDLELLFDFWLDRAETTEGLDRAQTATNAISATAQHTVANTPFSFRKAAQNPAQRKLIIPFGGTGCVSLYEIVSPSKVVVLAVRHQREEDDQGEGEPSCCRVAPAARARPSWALADRPGWRWWRLSA